MDNSLAKLAINGQPIKKAAVVKQQPLHQSLKLDDD
jgi:hypothetical protein